VVQKIQCSVYSTYSTERRMKGNESEKMNSSVKTDYGETLTLCSSGESWFWI
jgi:hypothetical protein